MCAFLQELLQLSLQQILCLDKNKIIFLSNFTLISISKIVPYYKLINYINESCALTNYF